MIQTCHDCEGIGFISDICYYCSGSGEGPTDGTICKTCKGTGELNEICSTCKGLGEITIKERGNQ